MTSYEFWTLLVNIFIAIGTVGAVIVAIYLPQMQNRPKLLVNYSIGRFCGMAGISNEQNFVYVSATNIGVIREYISSYGLEIGLLYWKRYGHIVPSNNKFEKNSFPSFVDPGEHISDYIEIELFNANQLSFFTEFFDTLPVPRWMKTKMLFLKIIMYSARCWVAPSRGRQVKALPAKSIRSHIINSYLARKTNKTS